jgi:hypothetical protein
MSNFWQHCAISTLEISKKKHFAMFCKNEACVNCETHKRHQVNLVIERLYNLQKQSINPSDYIIYFLKYTVPYLIFLINLQPS